MRDYQALAPALDGLRFNPDARFFFEMLSGGVVWSDELPPDSASTEEAIASALRGIWHYRTSLILGAPVERFKASWEAAQSAFPNWPGFHPSRRDTALAAKVKEIRDAANKNWLEQEAKYEAQLRTPAPAEV